MKKEVLLDGVKCAGCANTVQEKFSAIEGVESVKVDLANKKQYWKVKQRLIPKHSMLL